MTFLYHPFGIFPGTSPSKGPTCFCGPVSEIRKKKSRIKPLGLHERFLPENLQLRLRVEAQVNRTASILLVLGGILGWRVHLAIRFTPGSPPGVTQVILRGSYEILEISFQNPKSVVCKVNILLTESWLQS